MDEIKYQYRIVVRVNPDKWHSDPELNVWEHWKRRTYTKLSTARQIVSNVFDGWYYQARIERMPLDAWEHVE